MLLCGRCARHCLYECVDFVMCTMVGVKVFVCSSVWNDGSVRMGLEPSIVSADVSFCMAVVRFQCRKRVVGSVAS